MNEYSQRKDNLFMKIVTVWGILFISLMLPYLDDTYYSSNTVFVNHCISLFLAIVYGFYQRKKPQVICFNAENQISSFAVFLDYYSLLLPNFFFFCCLMLDLTIFPFTDNEFIDYLDAFLLTNIFFVYPLMFSLLLLYKEKYDKDACLTINIANNIFNNCLNEDRDFRRIDFYIEKFSYYFIKSINNVDKSLTKGVRIGDLEHDKNLPIKNVIMSNLHIYLKYSTQSDIQSFKNNLSSISKLFNNDNQINSLEIIKPIFSVYVDIKDFLTKRNYKIRARKDYLNIYLLTNYFSLLFLIGIIVYAYLDQLSGNIYSHLYALPLQLDPTQVIIAIIPLIGSLITHFNRKKDT